MYLLGFRLENFGAYRIVIILLTIRRWLCELMSWIEEIGSGQFSIRLCE